MAQKQNDANYAEQQRQKIKAATERLEAGIVDFFNSDSYKDYLKVMSKFHNYSYSNSILIALQKPDATLLAGYSGWEKKFKRHVKRGEKGIQIFAPAPVKTNTYIEREKLDPDTQLPVLDDNGDPVMETVAIKRPAFKIVTVFDVSQTYGEPLPELGVHDLTGDVQSYEDMMEAIRRTATVPIGFEDIPGESHGYYHQTEKRIAIQEGISQMQTVKTAIHELAHSRLHDIDTSVPANRQQRKADKATREVEAESIAYVVADHFGLDTSEYSFGYTATWSANKELPELKASLQTIRDAASTIITEIKQNLIDIQQERESELAVDIPEETATLADKPEPQSEKVAVAFYFVEGSSDREGSEEIFQTFPDVESALEAYTRIPEHYDKNIRMQSTEEAPSRMALIQCRDGIDTLYDIEAASLSGKWITPETIEAQQTAQNYLTFLHSDTPEMALPNVHWSMYIIPDLQTWSRRPEEQTPIERFQTFPEAADRFRELRHQPYITAGTEGEISPAQLTFGIERDHPRGAIELLQVRADQNVLSDEFMRMPLFADNPVVTNTLQRLENEFGFDQVLSQRPMTPEEVRAYTYERFKEKLEQGGLPGTEEYLSQFDNLYALGQLDSLKPLETQQIVTEQIPIDRWEHPCFEVKQDSPERLADAIHVFSHQYDELSGQSYTEILSQLSGDDASYLHEWLGSIVAEDSTFSTQARELQVRLEAISPTITAPEQAIPEAPDETRVAYYVAECMEFHSVGEYHESVSLEEALQLYSQIDPHRINGIPGIGIHVENNDRYEGEYELMSNGYLLTDVNNEISAYRDNPYVQQATADLTAALAALPPVKEPVDRTAEPKEAIFDFNGRYLHMQLSADNDWDYTVYSRNMETLNGGRIGDAYTSFAASRADLMQEYRLTEPFKEISPDQFEQMLAAHEESLHCPVCQLTLPDARAQGSLDEWRTNHQATLACARQFNEQYGDAYHARKVPEFLNMMVSRYGMERCKIVLASTIQSSPWDGRYHPYVRDGANQVKIPGASEDRDHDRRLDYLVSCHSVTVDVAFRDLMQMEKEQVLSDRPKAPQKKGKAQTAPVSGQKRPSVLKKLADKQAEIAAGDSKAKPVDRDKPQL